MTQFAQRVSSDFHLPRLLPREASEYIDHRVRVAGGQRGLFSSSAKKLIAEAAQGVPRQINVLADRCLVYAYAKSAGTVSSRIVRKAIEDRERHGIFSAQPAKACGADIGLNPGKVDVVDEVLKLTDGYGCDVYIEATGHPAAVANGLRMIRKLGTFVEFSVMREPVTVDWTIIGDSKELNIHGAHLGPYCYHR